ncbi:hypothetical protein L6164_029425 [Bauhinia variegata]|uniref:Uncharacterized protein n=1 Tax=Bauhinia variegata TaxID=167791 RepID=A0ACB9LAK2_BAUVA|nr:hypothetical protein L6164_029425 [Bauhinia variegata]
MVDASMEFRPRNYSAERQSHVLPRVRADVHPFSDPSLPVTQVDVVDHGNEDFFDPLRGTNDDEKATPSDHGVMCEADPPTKEWTSFSRLLKQRFPVSKMVSISLMPDVIIRSGKLHEKSSTSMHLEELDDPQKFADEGVRLITWQEYVSRLHELKDDINRSWLADDRITSLKLSIKVAKLLMDTSVLQFYPTLFVLVTDIMDMLGDLVWQRIKQKAEFAEDGTLICNLPDNFKASDVCSEAKETCNNWFCKIGAVRELLPRIYLELAILPCWRFLLDQPADNLQRLVMMIRGLADPVACAYCHLYMAHCAQKLPWHDIGYLITCVNDIRVILMLNLSTNQSTHGSVTGNKRLLVSLVEPSIEYIMKCIFKGLPEMQVSDVLVELGLRKNQQIVGSVPCVSVVLHHLLKELPIEVVSSNALEILHLIECSNDNSFDQHMNYRILGFRLYETGSPVDIINSVLDKVIQVIAQYDGLDEYLKVVEAYIDLVLQNQMESLLNTILEVISERAWNKGVTEDELPSLQSLLVKLLSHFKCLEDLFTLNHFSEILDAMYGNSRNAVFMHILSMATRTDHIRDPTTIQFLFEISQTLHDNMEFMHVKDDDSQVARLICRFVHKVDYGAEMERQLEFLVDCRGAFGRLNELKETLVHLSNCLAIQALKYAKKHPSFIKTCITFSEVTTPSISTPSRQLDLFLETAEVAFLGGLVSHSDGLLDSAISCLQSIDIRNGFRTPTDVEGLVSSVRKLCGFLVMIPGNSSLQATYLPSNLFTLSSSYSWMEPKMRTQIFSAIILLLATLSQNNLPYHANAEIPGNDKLYYGDSSYKQELVSLSKLVLDNLVDVIQKEPSQVARGTLALEACNCIASAFTSSNEILSACVTLIETAKSCLSVRDKYLQATIQFVDKQLQTSGGSVCVG